MSSSDKHVDAGMSEDAKREIDEACAGLYEIFKDKPRRQQEHFITYDLVIEDGEVRLQMSETGRIIHEALQGRE